MEETLTCAIGSAYDTNKNITIDCEVYYLRKYFQVNKNYSLCIKAENKFTELAQYRSCSMTTFIGTGERAFNNNLPNLRSCRRTFS